MREREIIDPIWAFLIAAMIGAVVLAGFASVEVPAHEENAKHGYVLPILEIYRNGKLVWKSVDPFALGFFREFVCHFLLPSNDTNTQIELCQVSFANGQYVLSLPMTPASVEGFELGFNGSTCDILESYDYRFSPPYNPIKPTNITFVKGANNETLIISITWNATFNGNLTAVRFGAATTNTYPYFWVTLMCDNTSVPFSFGDVLEIRYVIYFMNEPPIQPTLWNATMRWIFNATNVQSPIPSKNYLLIAPANVSWPWSDDIYKYLPVSQFPKYLADWWKMGISTTSVAVHLLKVFNEVHYPVGAILLIDRSFGTPVDNIIAYYPLNATYTLGNGNYLGVVLNITGYEVG